VGGAERNARKKRQAQLAGRGKPAVARSKSVDRKPVIIGVVVVVLLLGAVIGGVVYTSNKKNATEGENIAAKATTELDDAATGAAGDDVTYPVQRDGAAVLVGQKTAKVTLDVYEDFLCPVCHQFENEFGDDLTQHVKDGSLRLRYHMLPLLNNSSDPPGYSMDSANSGLCAADAGKFPQFHLSLYDAQPEEGARGWDKQQLAKLGQDLGITEPAFKSCVESGKYDSIIQSAFDKIRTTPYLQQDLNGQTGFGTPTVANGHEVVDTSNPKWLDALLANAG
jgi:protein-disulfide isomerase